jgi:hypothetical protein
MMTLNIKNYLVFRHQIVEVSRLTPVQLNG